MLKLLVILFVIKLYARINIFNNTFVFPDPEPSIIKILYGWYGIYGCFSLCFLLFSFAISYKLNIFVRYENDSSKENQISPRCYKLFQRTFFYNTYIEKPKLKRLKIIDLVSESPFYEELNVVKTDQAFKGNAIPYKVELINKKDPWIPSEASSQSILQLLDHYQQVSTWNCLLNWELKKRTD